MDPNVKWFIVWLRVTPQNRMPGCFKISHAESPEDSPGEEDKGISS